MRRPATRRPTRSGARAAAGSGSVVRGLRRARTTPRQPLATHDPFHRAPGHRDALALQVCPHLQAAVQALRRAFPVGVGFVEAGQDLGDRGIPQRPFRRRRRTVRPVGARGDLHAVHGQRPADRYDPELFAVLVDEFADQRRSGSHSRAKKLVAALSISIVYSSSWLLRRSSRSSRLFSFDTPATSPASTSACRTHWRSVSALIPSRAEIAFIAAHSEL